MREKGCIVFICQICYFLGSDSVSETCKKWKGEPPLTDRDELITVSSFVSVTQEKWGTIIWASAFSPATPTVLLNDKHGRLRTSYIIGTILDPFFLCLSLLHHSIVLAIKWASIKQVPWNTLYGFLILSTYCSWVSRKVTRLPPSPSLCTEINPTLTVEVD